ncbi:MAG: PAS domain S-box protein [Ignavibacteria bacterium]|nr:PAS domain S-box protein [Ignavibacteria bacterium]
MKGIPEKKYINFGFLLALLILVAVNIVIYLNIRFHFEDEITINKSLKILEKSEKLYASIVESETNRRGYLITNNNEFLDAYYPSIKSTDSVFNDLKIYITNSNEKLQLDTLQLFILSRRNLLDEAIKLQDEKDKNPNLQIEIVRKEKLTLERIKKLIESIQKNENNVINARLTEAERSSNYTLLHLIIGNIIAFTLLILAIFLLNRSVNRGRTAEISLEESRNWLATTLESIGDAVIVTSKIGEILFINKKAEELTGWMSAEAKGMVIDHVFNIYNHDTGRKTMDLVQEVVKSGNVINIEDNTILIQKNNEEIPIDDSAAPIINNENEIIGVVMVFRNIAERKKAENELLNSQKFIKRIAESIPAILYIYNLNGPQMTFANFKIAELLGYSPAEILSDKKSFFEEFIHPDDYRKLRNNLSRYLEIKDNEIIDFEYRIKNADGKYRWFRSHEVVFSRDTKGKPVEILGSAFDITTRKQLEQELHKYSSHLEELVDMRTGEIKAANNKLKEEINERAKAESIIIDAEEKFRTLVESALVGIYILDGDKYIYVNPKYEEIFGYNRGEMTGMSTWKIVAKDNQDFVLENIRKRIDNEIKTIQYVFKGITKQGKEIYVEVKGSTMLYDKKTAIIGTLQDITEKRHAEEMLMQQGEFLRTVIDTDPNFLFAKDWDGKFTMVNKAVAANYGTTAEDLIGKTDANFNNNTEELENFLAADREVISGKKPIFIPEEKVTNSVTGETKWYQTIKVPLKRSNGNIQVLGVSADITARKLAEEITQRSLKEKELLLKEIHHRVKNNLQIIISLLKLQSKFVIDPNDADIFNKSRSRVETMALIHEKLYKSQDISHIDLNSYLKELVNQLIKAYKIGASKVEFYLNAETIYVTIDTAIPCGLIVNELINNILKHAFPDGYNGKIELNLHRYNDNLLLEVSDNGVGIPGNVEFDNNDTLGMQLIDTLVKQLDGDIEVNKDNGTCFKILFKELKYKERI